MTVPGVNGDTQNIHQLFRQQRQDLTSLLTNVASANISGAQQALTAFQSDADQILSATGTTTSTASTSASTNSAATSTSATTATQTSASTSPFASLLQTDFSSLVAAVKGGNATDAQTALTKLEQDVQQNSPSVHGHRGGHQHHAEADAAANSTPTSTASTSVGATTVSATSATPAIVTTASTSSAGTSATPAASAAPANASDATVAAAADAQTKAASAAYDQTQSGA